MAPVFRPPTLSGPSGSTYDAIVVGSGIGGSVCAALLADAGLRVLVLEKNRELGGILASHRRDGFKLDAGSHLVSRGRRGPIGRLLRSLDLQHPRFITHDTPIASRGIFPSTAPPHRLGLPGSAWQVSGAMGLSAMERARLFRVLFETMTLTGPELRALDGVTLDEFLRRRTSSAVSYFLFAFLASIFFVLPPWRVSAGEALRCLRWIIWDYDLSYVEGGMDSLVHAFLGAAVEHGGEIVTGVPVRSVDREGRLARGGWQVSTGDFEVAAPIVVCNLAPRDAMALVHGASLPSDYLRKVEGLETSGNAHQIKLALDEKLVDEGCIIGGISLRGLRLEDLSFDLATKMIEDIGRGHVPDPLAVYAPVPTNYDPSLAPENCQLIAASVYGGNGAGGGDPPELWKERGIEALASVIPGLRDHLLFVEHTPIPELGRWMGRSSAAAIATAQTPEQVGARRLPVKTPLAGIYLCGDGAGGRGIGTELAASSGEEAALAILKERRAA